MSSAPGPLNSDSKPDDTLIGLIAKGLRDAWRSGGLREMTSYVLRVLKAAVFSKPALVSPLFGAGVGILVALGQGYAIGFSLAWKIYGRWWALSPLLGPLFLLSVFVGGSALQYLDRYVVKCLKGSLQGKILGLVLVIVMGAVIGAAIVLGGYEAARQDNPLLTSQPANLEDISKSLGDQNRILGGLSESGAKLVGQLNATEVELQAAKKQLAVTLSNFDAQRRAAQQVTEELRQLDDRQKQIALETAELERILGGQQPITRHDLQRANFQGLISGILIGFVTSFLASIAYNALRKGKPVSG